MIPTITHNYGAGKPNDSPQEMNKVFRDFYAKLYSSDNDPGQTVLDSFFKNTELPQLKERADKLDAPFPENELSIAFNRLPSDKSPGPDSFPDERFQMSDAEGHHSSEIHFSIHYSI